MALIATALRFWNLDLQPYWVDETWSIGVASLPLADSLHTIRFEIHPPTYQVILWAWVHLGGTGHVWTRLLSALFGAVGVILSFTLLRRTNLPVLLRLLFTVASAVSGMAIVYAQETRSYSLAWCLSVAVTALTLRMTLRPGELPTRRVLIAWICVGALASSIHLFDALLVIGAGIAIALRWRRRPGLVAGLTLLAISPQVIWIVLGRLLTPGFATASAWIPAPQGADVGELLETVFAVGGLHFTPTGFAWTSPWGVVVVAVIATVLILGRYVWMRRQGFGAGRGGIEWFPTATLAVMAVSTIALAWVIGQFVHIWTVRNLIVVQPALTWCVIALVFTLATQVRIVRPVVAAVLLLFVVDLVFIGASISRPYKPFHQLPANVESMGTLVPLPPIIRAIEMAGSAASAGQQ